MYSLTNLLKDHPDGLGKHVEVYHGHILNESNVYGYFETGSLPYMVVHPKGNFTIILGSDLVLGKLPEYRIPFLNEVNSVYNSLHFYTDQIYHYLGLDKRELKVLIVAQHG